MMIMKKLFLFIALMFIGTIGLAESPIYNIQSTPIPDIVAGNIVSINYTFGVRTTDTVPIYFQFNITGKNTTIEENEFVINGNFQGKNLTCSRKNTIFDCFIDNSEINLLQGNYSLYSTLTVAPNTKPDVFTISFSPVSGIRQVDYFSVLPVGSKTASISLTPA
ncbi:hypothetical protein D4Q76_02750, partial [archaeon]